MKKSDIIDAYNALLPEVQKAQEKYKETTGEDFATYRCSSGILGPCYMNYSKDDLERFLNDRQNLIIEINNAIEIYVNTKQMMSTKEGQNFIQSLEEKKKSILDKLSDCKRQFITSLDNLLYNIGLTDWKTVPYDYEPGSPYNYVSIYNITDKWCTMRLSIIRRNGNWTLEPNVSIYSGNHDVSQKETQYLQCLAFVTLCDHSKGVHKWMETIVDPLVKRGNDLKNEIDKIDEQLKDPYTAWQESK